MYQQNNEFVTNNLRNFPTCRQGGRLSKRANLISRDVHHLDLKHERRIWQDDGTETDTAYNPPRISILECQKMEKKTHHRLDSTES